MGSGDSPPEMLRYVLACDESIISRSVKVQDFETLQSPELARECFGGVGDVQQRQRRRKRPAEEPMRVEEVIEQQGQSNDGKLRDLAVRFS